MQRRKFMVLLSGAAVWSSPAGAQGTTQVTVLDAEFRPIRAIATGPDLATFSKHWATRRRSADAAMQPHYRIVIQYGRRSERWLYDPAGFTRVLTKKKTPVYRLGAPTDFNVLLGITSQRVP